MAFHLNFSSTASTDVKLTNKIEIVPEGILKGNINSQKVVLAEGSLFKGKIDMPIGKDTFPEKKTVSTEKESQPKDDQETEKT